jgi:outer membrane protein TolC
VYDPALQATSQGGVEQALAEFDAQLSTNLFWDRTDRPQNVFRARIFNRDNVTHQTELAKQSATGAQFFVRSETIYDDTPDIQGIASNRPLTIDWTQSLEAEVRQPLLRGRGTQVNRIPIVIARIQEDLAVHDFQINVRNMVSDVENAYWALYFAYRNLEATKIGRDSALATWKRIYALVQAGAAGGSAENEAQSREQYFFFRARLQDALNRVYTSEKQLRYLLGLTPTDSRIIRPADEPTTALVRFDWHQVLAEALIRRPELRRQKWLIKQRELELIAVRNQLLPQLDLVALYRFLGIGDKPFGNNQPGAGWPAEPVNPANPFGPTSAEGTTAWDELLGGDYQEGRLGIQLTIPMGYRRELAQVRNRQLLLARDRAVLEDMELEVTHQLTTAIQELEANYAISRSNLNRIRAAVQEVEAIQAAYDAGTATLDRLLDAQRRRSDAEVAYAQSLADYNLAIVEVHLRKGSLLEYDNVLLAEGPWPAKAYYDAHALARRRDASYYLDYGYSRPKVVSRGPVQQQAAGAAVVNETTLSDPTGEVDLEPIPAPEPELQDAQPSIEPSAEPLQPPVSEFPPLATQQDGPVLSAPQSTPGAPRRKPGVLRAAFEQPKTNSAAKSSSASSPPPASASAKTTSPAVTARASNTAATAQPATPAQKNRAKTTVQLKWK